MIEQAFSLIPFPAPSIPAITIGGKISFQDHFLSLHYSLAGNIEQVLLPPPSLNPGRRDELWKATCFEFFLAVKDQPGYWEFNMSPSGDWNVYRMDAYRRAGFREEIAVSQLAFAFKEEPDRYSLDASMNLSTIGRPEEQLQMAVAVVIQTKDGGETYWALTHPASQADFHSRESFVLTLAGQTHPSEQSVPGG